MHLEAIVILAAGALIAGLLLYLPFWLWFRRRRRLRLPLARGEMAAAVPAALWALAGSLVLLMLTAVAWQTFAPDSWLGRLLGLPGAIRVLGWLFAALVFVLGWLAVKAVRAAKARGTVDDDEGRR